MGLRKVLLQGDKALLRPSRVVTEFNERLHQLLDDLQETNDQNEGMGMAAPQVGVLRRAFVVVDLSGAEDVTIEFVNPEIIETSEETEEAAEGCLSVPNIWAMVTRFKSIKVKAQDRHGASFELFTDDPYMSRAIQHELDHINGALFTQNAGRYLSEEEIDAVMIERDRELRKRRKAALAESGARRARTW